MKRSFLAIVILVCAASATSTLRADVAAVNKYLADATELVGKGPQFFDDARGKLELAEASMDDVPADEKPALAAKIEALKSQIQSAAGAQDKARIERKVKDLIEQLEGLVGNLVAWPGKSAELTAILDDPKTAAALDEPALAGYRKQLATMTKVHQGKALKENLATAQQQVDELEKSWTEQKAKVTAADANEQSRGDAIVTIQRDLQQIERFFKDLPADNADVKALRDRVAKVQTDSTAAAGAAGSASQIERINRYFASEGDAISGAEAETAEPTWADFKTGNAAAREFGAPKTVEYLRKVSYFMGNLSQEKDYQSMKDAPAVKARVAEINTKLSAGRAKIAKSATKLLNEAEAEKINANNVSDISLLQQAISSTLGADSPEGQPLVARADKLQKDFYAAGNKAENDKLAYYKSMTEQADKAWPAMMAKFDVSEGFDPNNAGAMKGKYIKIVGNNLMGWRFKPGDFPYATKINGVAVAGRYDPAVKSALSEVEGKIGRSIGDSDDDGEWTAIAHVDGGTGKLVELVRSSGDVKIDGSSVGTVEATDERPVDAPIVTLVALKAGPVAVAEGQGAVKSDGSISAPVGAAGAVGGRRGISFFGILLGLLSVLVGLACLMKARFAPLAANAQAVQMSEKIGSDNIAYLGLAGVALGVIGLLMNLIALPSAFFAAVIGLLTSAAMIIAGGVASRGFLDQRNLVPAQAGPILNRFAVPAGIACVALGALTVIASLF